MPAQKKMKPKPLKACSRSRNVTKYHTSPMHARQYNMAESCCSKTTRIGEIYQYILATDIPSV